MNFNPLVWLKQAVFCSSSVVTALKMNTSWSNKVFFPTGVFSLAFHQGHKTFHRPQTSYFPQLNTNTVRTPDTSLTIYLHFIMIILKKKLFRFLFLGQFVDLFATFNSLHPLRILFPSTWLCFITGVCITFVLATKFWVFEPGSDEHIVTRSWSRSGRNK